MEDIYRGIRQTDQPAPERVVIEDSLSLDLDDGLLLSRLSSKIDDSRQALEKNLKWWEKGKLAEDIWGGRHIDENELYPWQTEYMNPVIFRNIETIIPIAVSRIPAPEALPGNQTDQSKALSLDLEDALEYRAKKEHLRSKIRLAIRHLFLYKLGCIKTVWDPNIGLNGDIRYEVIHPSRIYAFDYTTPDQDSLEFFVELIEESVHVMVKKFPGKKEEIYQLAGIKDPATEDKKVTYQEVWFTFIGQDGAPQEGVLWRYGGEILGKTKHPYWDWGGEDRGMIDEFGMESDSKVYRNFMDNPSKPYSFFNYLNLGKQLIDDTSLLEQVWVLQKNVNKRGMQITDMADAAQGKDVFSTDGIKDEEIDQITPDPNEDIRVSGDVRTVHAHIPGVPPPEALFADRNANVADIDNVMGAHSETRGERRGTETATGRSILREGDYGRIDDLVQEAIENGVDRIYQQSAQLMKRFYTEDHFIKLVGRDGSVTFKTFNRDAIEDGMEVFVQPGSSLPVDKLSKRAEALELSAGNKIAPDDLFDRLGWDDPVETALKTVVFNTEPAKYAQIIASGQKFSEVITQEAQAAQQAQAQAQAQAQPAAPAAPGMEAGAEARIPAAPEAGGEMEQAMGDAANALAQMRAFAESEKFQMLTPEQQQGFMDQMQMLNERAKELGGGA